MRRCVGVSDGVSDTVGEGVGDSVGDGVGDTVGDDVGDSVGDGIGLRRIAPLGFRTIVIIIFNYKCCLAESTLTHTS